MTPRKTLKSPAVLAVDFDFDGFLGGFKRPEFTSHLYQRADLAPKLKTLEEQLDELDSRIDKLERAEGENPERSIDEVNPLAELLQRRERITGEFNDLANEFNDSAVEFTFRVPDKKDDHTRIQGLMDEAGVTQPEKPADGEDTTEFDKEFSVWWDTLVVRSMSVTCVSHPFTVEQWESLRDRVGELAFNELGSAWFEAVQAAAPTTAFLPKALPTPVTVES